MFGDLWRHSPAFATSSQTSRHRPVPARPSRDLVDEGLQLSLQLRVLVVGILHVPGAITEVSWRASNWGRRITLVRLGQHQCWCALNVHQKTFVKQTEEQPSKKQATQQERKDSNRKREHIRHRRAEMCACANQVA